MKMKYRLELINCEVSLEAETADSVADIETSGGDEDSGEELRFELRTSHGIYGHLLGDRTTPIDLAVAMSQPRLQRYRPELIEGQELLSGYERSVPDGVVD